MEDYLAGDASLVLKTSGAERPGVRFRQSSARITMETVNIPNNLVCVGMKYRPTIAYTFYKEIASNVSSYNRQVVLSREYNINGVNNYAWAVIVDNVHIAYVRNKDVYLLEKIYEKTKKVKLENLYIIKSCAGNYFLLNSKQRNYVLPVMNELYIEHYNDREDALSYVDTFTIKVAANKVEEKRKQIEERKVMNSNKIKDMFFQEVKNVVFDIQTGHFGISDTNGISVFSNGSISVNPIVELSVSIPAFAVRSNIDTLNPGDIVVLSNETVFFKFKSDNGAMVVISASGEEKNIAPVTNMFMGNNTVLAVKNMFGTGTNPLMMAMLMSDKKDFDPKLLAFMAMNQNGGNIDPMMMALMFMK